MISPPPRVVVLGAGVAGLEAAFLLARRLSGRADVHVAYDDDTFLLRPNLVYVPFGADPSASTLHLSFLSTRGRAREGAPQRVLSHRWRAAKRVFSSYLLMQFAAGEPFQAGPGWRSMDFGVHGVHAMAGML